VHDNSPILGKKGSPFLFFMIWLSLLIELEPLAAFFKHVLLEHVGREKGLLLPLDGFLEVSVVPSFGEFVLMNARLLV